MQTMAQETALTKEYFDKQLKKELKGQLEVTEKRIMDHVDKRIDDLAAQTARGLSEIQASVVKIDTRQRVENLERDNRKTKEALNITP